MNDYVNMDGLKETIREIFNEKIADYQDKPFFECTSYADEDMVDEMIEWRAESINRDMCKYLHMSDHNIPGNFKNVKWNYEDDFGYGAFKDMVKRLDDGMDDEKTNEDRDWLADWFWSAFGTWGMGYNLSSEIGEELYVAEKEYAEST